MVPGTRTLSGIRLVRSITNNVSVRVCVWDQVETCVQLKNKLVPVVVFSGTLGYGWVPLPGVPGTRTPYPSLTRTRISYPAGGFSVDFLGSLGYPFFP